MKKEINNGGAIRGGETHKYEFLLGKMNMIQTNNCVVFTRKKVYQTTPTDGKLQMYRIIVQTLRVRVLRLRGMDITNH